MASNSTLISSKSVIMCNKCIANNISQICYHDTINSLANKDISTCQIFQHNSKNEKRCLKCHHKKKHHYRTIPKNILIQLFADSKDCNFNITAVSINELGGLNIINLIRNPLDNTGTSPFLWMTILWKNNRCKPQKKLNFIKYLELNYKPNFNLKSRKGCNIIHNLCFGTGIVDVNTSQLLLNYFTTESKCINETSFKSLCFKNKTPLHYAAYYDRLDCIKILIKYYNKQDILSLKDKSGKSIISLAQKHNNIQIVEYLMQYTGTVYDNDVKSNDNDNDDVYHEKQAWEMCLLHALNGLLQKQVFTNKLLDDICKELAPNKMINPHKSIFQTGNYDANVLMMALNKKDIDVQWFDARKVNQLNLSDPKFLEPDNTFKFLGFILNNPQKTMFKLFTRRHWLAIILLNDEWLNLDSKLKKPKKYNNVDELVAFLVNALTTNNAELMICRQKIKYQL